MPFPNRFMSICRKRTGSPQTISGTWLSTSHNSSRPCSSARSANVFKVFSTHSLRSKSIISRSILPASIFEKSSMSLMTINRESAESLTVSRYSRCSLERSVSSARSVIPITPFIGVRISWLMLARNSLLARFVPQQSSIALQREL